MGIGFHLRLYLSSLWNRWVWATLSSYRTIAYGKSFVIPKIVANGLFPFRQPWMLWLPPRSFFNSCPSSFQSYFSFSKNDPPSFCQQSVSLNYQDCSAGLLIYMWYCSRLLRRCSLTYQSSSPQTHLQWVSTIKIAMILLQWNRLVMCAYTLAKLDYTCIILGIAFILGLVNWWFHARKNYNGPTVELYGRSLDE